MLITTEKRWDAHVEHAEEVARGAGFQALRDRILELAAPQPGEVVVDVGAGTGLLALALASGGARVWAIDISPLMCEYLRTKSRSAGLADMTVGVASAVSLPLVDGHADVVVSNYCFHHLREPDKHRALAEVHRVLKPGGRFVFGDMMFQLSLGDPRDRAVVTQKVRALAARGPAGMARLAKNAARVATRRWEHPARTDWWRHALLRAGFDDITIVETEHEGGIAYATRP